MTKKQTKRPANLTTREVLALSLTDSMKRRAAAQRKLIESKMLLAKRIDNAVRDETKGGTNYSRFWRHTTKPLLTCVEPMSVRTKALLPSLNS
jgi:hypothetical protein